MTVCMLLIMEGNYESLCSSFDDCRIVASDNSANLWTKRLDLDH